MKVGDLFTKRENILGIKEENFEGEILRNKVTYRVYRFRNDLS